MENNLLPFAKRSDVDKFRKQFPALRCIFQKYAARIKVVFQRFAGLDQDDAEDLDTMNLKEFFAMLKEKKLLDARLPHKLVQHFQNVQSDDTAFGDEEDVEVDYDEFLEAICAIGCIIFPNPYESFEQRIKRSYSPGFLR